MKSPAFQFYPADYLASQRVQMMTLEEEGAYIRLLSSCWQHGSIPSDPQQVARLIGKGASTTLATTLLTMFQPTDSHDRMTHDRLEAEKHKQAVWREKSAAGGRKSAEKRKGASTTLQPPLIPNLNQQGNQEATLHLQSSSSSIKKEKESLTLPFSSEKFKDAWTLWLTHKKEIGQKMPPTTISLQLKKCAKWGESRAIAAIEEAVSNKWQGLFEPKAQIKADQSQGSLSKNFTSADVGI